MFGCSWWKKCWPTTRRGMIKFFVWGFVLVLLGTGLIIVANIIPPFLHEQFRQGMVEATMLDSNTSNAYETWSGWGKDSTPATVKFYFYDIKNPLEILNGEIPVVEEVGPIAYRLHKKMFDVSWSNESQVINFRTWSYYEFVAEESTFDENYEITSLNMPFVALRGILPESFGLNNGLDSLRGIYVDELGYSQMQMLFCKRPLKDLIWGYEDAGFRWAHDSIQDFPSRYAGISTNTTSIDEARNNSKIYLDSLYTGVENEKKLRNYLKYQGSTMLMKCSKGVLCPPNDKILAWKDETHSRVFGSDGSAFHPDIDQSEELDMFMAPFFRTVKLVYRDTATYKGISVYNFGMSPKVTYNASILPDNAFYDQLGYSGVMNITSILSGVPTFISKARMIDVDDRMFKGAKYIFSSPCPRGPITDPTTQCYQDADTRIYVEPRSGLAIHGAIRGQVNIFISPLTGIPSSTGRNTTTWFQNLRPTYMPLFWSSQEGTIDDDDAKKFSTVLKTVKTLTNSAHYAGWACGIVFCFVGIAICSWCMYRLHCNLSSESETIKLLEQHDDQKKTKNSNSTAVSNHTNSSTTGVDTIA